MKTLSELKKIALYIKWVKSDVKPFLKIIIFIVFMQSLQSLLSVTTAIASKWVIDYAIAGKLGLMAIYAFVFIGIVLLLMGLNVYLSLITVQVQENMSNSIRQRFFLKFMKTEWILLSNYHSGDLLTRMTSDIGTISSGIVSTLPGFFALGIQLIAAFATLFHYEPRLAVIAFALSPAMLIFSRLFGRKLKKIQIHVQESESSYRAYIQEALQNLLIIKSFGLEDRSQETLLSLHKNRMKWIIKRNKTTLAASTALGLGYWVGYFLAFIWGAIKISQKAITYGTMTIFLQLVGQVQGPFIGLARTVPQIISIMASIDRLKELEQLPQEKETTKVPCKDSIGICINETSFNYSNGRQVLNKISTEIKPGNIVGIIGPSGEGKTTIIRLLLAFINPTEGDVYFVDETGNKYEVSSNTREWISYVPQGNTLFSGSIADNLRYGKYDATYEEIKNALEAASAWEFIKDLSDGIDTVIGEKGLGLSEGQAQRIAIARAFLRKAPILILDEATSSLDVKSEMHILNEIKKIASNCICLVITHRLSALKICTKVIKLNDGVLTEEAV